MDDGRIFDELHPALRRFAAVVCPPDLEVDDLLQEALARTLRVGPLSDLADPLVYLRRVVANLAINHRSSFTRRAGIQSRVGRPELESVDQHTSDLDELRRLPADQRAVLYLHVVEGAPHDEIADVLGITPEASRARLSRGLKALRIHLADQEVPT